MTETKTSKSWFDQITPAVLGRASPSRREGADYAQSGSVCTSRHPGDEPPDEVITTIARIR
jgi:hypothetical protein